MKSFTRYFKRLLFYTKLWWIMSKNSFLSFLQNRFGILVFLAGKILRFAFFFGFLFYLLKTTKSLAGYNFTQVAFFYLTFNVIDVITQFLFREVYRFRPLVINGGFDLTLSKPFSALFRALMGGADLLDLVTIPPLLFATYYVGSLLNPTFSQVILYLFLVLNGFLIATAFHIAVISLGIITLEIDHSIMIYRDLTNLGRLPIDIYKQPLRSIITFLIPVGIMVTIPAKVLMGVSSNTVIAVAFILGIGFFFLSIKFWGYALRFYTSASS
jgi:viologen exporter family transport system permease protein